MTMEDWVERLDAFLEFTERDILQTSAKVSAEIAKEHAESEFKNIVLCRTACLKATLIRFYSNCKT